MAEEPDFMFRPFCESRERIDNLHFLGRLLPDNDLFIAISNYQRSTSIIISDLYIGGEDTDINQSGASKVFYLQVPAQPDNSQDCLPLI